MRLKCQMKWEKITFNINSNENNKKNALDITIDSYIKYPL